MELLCFALFIHGTMNTDDHKLFELEYENIRVAVYNPEQKIKTRKLLCHNIGILEIEEVTDA